MTPMQSTTRTPEVDCHRESGMSAVEHPTDVERTEKDSFAQQIESRFPGRATVGDSDLSNEDRLLRTECLLDQYEKRVFGYAYRLTGCRPSAEDITQEVFLRAFRSLHQLRDEGAAKAWLLTITRNEFTRWLRKSLRGEPSRSTDGGDGSIQQGQSTSAEQHVSPLAVRRDMPSARFAPKTSGAVCDIAGEVQTEDSGPSNVERDEWIQCALRKLPEDYRLVVLMYYFEQLSYAEIADQLRIPIGTVMSRLSRGKTQLRRGLEALSQPQVDETE